MIIINAEKEDIVKEEHVCWTTKERGMKISLFEVILVTYKHPQAKEYATITQLETRQVETVKRINREGASYIELIENAENVINKIKGINERIII